LSQLEQQYPNIVKQVVGGTSYEGREIRGIEINFNSNNPGVYFESGIHAREWIGPAASSWIVNEILRSPSNSVWRRFNYLYFPSINPDGYAYTFSNVS
jgi:murein tripeptide amidase MpaA